MARPLFNTSCISVFFKEARNTTSVVYYPDSQSLSCVLFEPFLLELSLGWGGVEGTNIFSSSIFQSKKAVALIAICYPV